MECEISEFEKLIPQLKAEIEAISTKRGEQVQCINQDIDANLTLVSFKDVVDINTIEKKNVMNIQEYLEKILIPEAKKEITAGLPDYTKLYADFKDKILEKLQIIEKICEDLTDCNSGGAFKFLKKFSKGLLKDAAFRKKLQKVIASIANRTSTPIDLTLFNKATTMFNSETDSILKEIQDFETTLTDIFKILSDKVDPVVAVKRKLICPKSIQQVDHFIINQGKSLPSTRGIDLHPTKNILIACGKDGGDLVIRNLDTNLEISRIKMQDNSGGYAQDTYLWSPSGQKILAATYSPSNIYIFDENGTIIKTLEQVYNSNCWGAIWLNESDIAIGYADGLLKIQDIEKDKEITLFKLNKNVYAMANLDSEHLLVGDSTGILYNINWKEELIEWKVEWHESNCSFRVISVSNDKTRLLTGSNDELVKCMLIKDQSKQWEFKMNDYVIGVMWSNDDCYILALSFSNQLVMLDPFNGSLVLEYNGLSSICKSMVVNYKTKEVFVGDSDGTIRRLKLVEQTKQE